MVLLLGSVYFSNVASNSRDMVQTLLVPSTSSKISAQATGFLIILNCPSAQLIDMDYLLSYVRHLAMKSQQTTACSSSTSSPNPDVEQDSLLLNMPLCLICNLFDELEWPDQVVFSQTCRGLWHNFHSSSHLSISDLVAKLFIKLIEIILCEKSLCH